MRLSRLHAHLNAAQGYAKLSKAKRLKVGAVLVKDDRIISIGYNGTPSGMDNACEYRLDHLNLLDELVSVEWRTKPEVCHAEMNVIAFAAKNGISTDGASLVITHSPCFECCKILVQSGIREVYYKDEYRDTSGIDFLKENNVTVRRIANVKGTI